MAHEAKFTAELKGTDSVYTTLRKYSDGTIFSEVTTLKAGAPHTEKAVTVTDADKRTLIFWVFIQVLFVTMVYGPIAAFLVEMFPVKIRYTSMSLPYHVGNGIFGGLLPAIATFLVTRAGAINEKAVSQGLLPPIDKPYLEGLWYPMVIAGICLVIGVVYLDGKDNRVND